MEKASDLIAALPNHPPNYRPSGSIGVKFALDTGRFLKDGFLKMLFGIGWALTGAGFGVILMPLVAAFVGTWAYGLFRDSLPD